MPSRLSLQEKIEIILLCVDSSLSSRDIASKFNNSHSERNMPISHVTVITLLKKFKETGSVLQEKKPKQHRATNDEISQLIRHRLACYPKISSRKLAQTLNISQSSTIRILKKEKFHPYKILYKQKLNEDDPDRLLEFCNWLLSN